MGKTRSSLASQTAKRLRSAVQAYALRCRTRTGHHTAAHYLDCLATALAPAGWRCLRLYRPDDFPLFRPMLRVYAPGADDVEIWIHVRAEAHGRWSYYEAGQDGTAGHLFHCGDAKGAAEQVGRVLQERMYPF